MKYLIVVCILVVSIVTGHVNFILMGPPSSGKRTFGMYLEKNHGYYQIFPSNTKWYVPVPSIPDPLFANSKYFYGCQFHTMHEQVEKCIQQQRPFVLHHFPRNKCSLDFLQDLCQLYKLKETIRIVYFVVDDETCLERANNRIVCLNCYTIFNKITRPPTCQGRCDTCKAILTVRTIDQEFVKKRLVFYRKSIEPLVELAEQYFHSINFFSDVPLQECAQYYESFLA